jgi:hypothetical protein
VSAAEALVLGMKAGLDPSTMVKVLGDGAGSSRMLQVRGPMMARNDYADAAMKVGVWQKFDERKRSALAPSDASRSDSGSGICAPSQCTGPFG